MRAANTQGHIEPHAIRDEWGEQKNNKKQKTNIRSFRLSLSHQHLSRPALHLKHFSMAEQTNLNIFCVWL